MSRNTKLQLGYGVVLLVFMLIQMSAISSFRSNHENYSKERTASLREDLQEDGFSSSHASTISWAIRDMDFMLSSDILSTANSLIFFNAMGLIMAMTFFSALIKKDEKSDE